jgi:hypothetical protein
VSVRVMRTNVQGPTCFVSTTSIKEEEEPFRMLPSASKMRKKLTRGPSDAGSACTIVCLGLEKARAIVRSGFTGKAAGAARRVEATAATSVAAQVRRAVAMLPACASQKSYLT